MKYLLCLCIMLTVNTLNAQNTICDSTEFRQFDFWLGEWQVFNPEGELVGLNIITKEQGGCVLKENWTSLKSDYTGTSYNFFNTKTDQWQQIWVDNKGGNLQLFGNFFENRMVLKSDWLKDKKDRDFQHRITWTLNSEGSINQLWETLNKNKEVQKVLFNGTYRPK